MENKTVEESQSLSAKTFWVMVVTVISKCIGFVREAVLAALFGATWQKDAFQMAVNIISMITGVTTSLTTAIVPVRTAVMADEGKEQADRYVSTLFNITMLFAVIAGFAAFPLAPWIVKIFAPKFTGITFQTTVTITRIFLPIIALNSAVSIFTGILNTHDKYLIHHIVGLTLSLSWMTVPLILANVWGIYAVVTGYMLGTVLQVVLRLPELRNLFRYSLSIDWCSPHMKKTFSMCLPIFVGIAYSSIGQAVDKALASGLVEGSVSAASYATLLTGMVHSIIAIPILTSMYTTITRSVQSGDMDGLKALLIRVCSVLSIMLLPITVYCLIFSPEIIQAVFQRGAFDERAAILTSGAFFYYAIGIVFIAFNSAFVYCFYSLQDTKTPIILGLFSVGIDVALNFILVQSMQLAGLALATSIGAMASASMMFIALRRKIGAMGSLRWLKAIGTVFIAIIPWTAVCLLVKHYVHMHALLVLFIALIPAGILYVGALLLLKQPDVMHYATKFKERLMLKFAR